MSIKTSEQNNEMSFLACEQSNNFHSSITNVRTRLGAILVKALLTHSTFIYNASIKKTFIDVRICGSFCRFDYISLYFLISYYSLYSRQVLDFGVILGIVYF